MKAKILVVLVLGMLLLSIGTGLSTVSATVWPDLPTNTVQLSVVNGANSYFISTLSGIPADYDIRNGVYKGWCIDRSEDMVRSVSHGIVLHSSLNPPSALQDIEWGAINYILNHKQGTMMDVQNAIWYFTNGESVSDNAQTMVNNALENLDYRPISGEFLAIICYDGFANNGNQNTILEIKLPCLRGLSPGFWKHNVAVALDAPGSYSSPYEGAPKLTYADMAFYVSLTSFKTDSNTIDEALESALSALSAKGKGSAEIRLDACNQFNSAAGFLPYND